MPDRLILMCLGTLQAHELCEVYTGGLSSYTVTWTIVAHIMQEGFLLADPVAATTSLPQHLLPPYHLLPDLLYSPTLDLGALLYGYLCRYSRRNFDTQQEAVSVLQV